MDDDLEMKTRKKLAHTEVGAVGCREHGGQMETRAFECHHLETVASVQEYMERIEQLKAKHKSVTWYRGHSDHQFRLVPTIGRAHKFNGKEISFSEEQEGQLLHRFRRRAYPHVGRILNEWEGMFLARHHALPTRILDWTRLPLVGLYFACVQNQDLNGDVWVMVRFDEGSKDDLDVLRLSTREKSPLRLFETQSNHGDATGRTGFHLPPVLSTADRSNLGMG